jgi:phage replication O-like protein O
MTDSGDRKQFVRYPVQIQEALYTTSLTAYESKILHFIIRKTFGWNITADRISQRQIEAATGVDRRSVRRCLKQLRKRKIIHNNPHAKGGRNRTPTIGVNPNVNQWIKVGAVQPPQGVGAEMVQGGRNLAPISGRTTTPYNRKKTLNNRKGGDPSPASGKSGTKSPLLMSEEQAQKNIEQVKKLRDSLNK